MRVLRIRHHKEGIDIRGDVLIHACHFEFPFKIGDFA